VRFRFSSSCSLVFACLFVSQSMALPYPKRSPQIGSASLSGLETTILADDISDALYVSPKNTRNIEGVFSFTNGSLDCTDLNNLRKSIYRAPEEAKLEEVLKSNSPYSPVFEYALGRIKNLQADTAEFRLQHAELVGEYEAADEALRLNTEEKNEVDAQVAATQSALTTAITLSLNPALTHEERALMVQKAQERFVLETAENAKRSAEVSASRIEAIQRFTAALKAWSPYKGQMNNLREVQTALEASFNTIQNVVRRGYDRSMQALNEIESKPIGVASVGYNVAMKLQK
jgi:hypothetical protein